MPEKIHQNRKQNIYDWPGFKTTLLKNWDSIFQEAHCVSEYRNCRKIIPRKRGALLKTSLPFYICSFLTFCPASEDIAEVDDSISWIIVCDVRSPSLPERHLCNVLPHPGDKRIWERIKMSFLDWFDKVVNVDLLKNGFLEEEASGLIFVRIIPFHDLNRIQIYKMYPCPMITIFTSVLLEDINSE